MDEATIDAIPEAILVDFSSSFCGVPPAELNLVTLQHQEEDNVNVYFICCGLGCLFFISYVTMTILILLFCGDGLQWWLCPTWFFMFYILLLK
jgi:hypothetical protein